MKKYKKIERLQCIKSELNCQNSNKPNNNYNNSKNQCIYQKFKTNMKIPKLKEILKVNLKINLDKQI